jgi:hypothetical protein
MTKFLWRNNCNFLSNNKRNWNICAMNYNRKGIWERIALSVIEIGWISWIMSTVKKMVSNVTFVHNFALKIEVPIGASSVNMRCVNSVITIKTY